MRDEQRPHITPAENASDDQQLTTGSPELDALITEVASGAAEEGDRRRLEALLAENPAAAAQFSRLEGMIQMTRSDAWRQCDPGDAFWNQFGDQLEKHIQTESARPAASRGASSMRLVRTSMQVAAALLLLSLGFLWGRGGFSPATADELASSQIVMAELQQRTLDHLERSRTLLLGVVNFDADYDDPVSLNLDRRSTLASSMVEESAALRADMTGAEWQHMIALLEDLEFVLLQLANLESSFDIPGLELIQQGAERDALLFKIDIESMNVSRQAAPEPAPSSASPPQAI